MYTGLRRMRSESVGSETTDEEKRFVIMKLNEKLRKIVPILSKISDEEVVRAIREDRETNHGKNPELARLGDLAGVHLKNKSNDVERM
jgi:hypothetical protein